MDSRVAGYANALFEAAKAEGVLARVEEELFALSGALEQNDGLRQTLSDASLPVEARQGVVEDLLGAKACSPVTTNLVSFVVGAGRGRDLPAIIATMVEKAAADRSHALAEVRSAVPLSDDQRARLASALSAGMGRQVEVKVTVDPAVLGGLSARVGDVVIDGTVRSRLEQLRQAV
ncbi:MAG: ATP synthase F1 subunit delta [Acidimicrobiales bacterium]